MQSLKQQADAAISKMIDTANANTNAAFNVTNDILNGLEKVAKSQINTDLAVLRADAASQFALGMETVGQAAKVNPSGGVKFIQESGEKLLDKISEQYGDLGDEFRISAINITRHTQLKYLSQTDSGTQGMRLKQATTALSTLASNSHTIPPEALASSINSVHDAVNAEYGNNTGELVAHNAYEIAKLRGNVVAAGKYVSKDQPPVIPNTEKTTELNTSIGTNLQRLSVDNPMLARAFTRIHDLTSAQASELANNIRKQFPDSPEPAAIETATTLRAQALQQNPLEFGANQLYYGLTSSAKDAFTGENDHRFDAAKTAFQKFGTTNFYTEDEKKILKEAPLEAKIGAYLKTREKLGAYNSKQKGGEQIDPTFLRSEFNKIDGDAVSWGDVISAFPQYASVAVNDINNIAKNMRLNGAMPKAGVPDQLLRVSGIGGVVEKLTAANYAKTGKVEGVSEFFSTRDNYAYPRSYEHGSRFQDIVIDSLKKNVRLVNTGIDTYAVYTLKGDPLIINGSTVQYLGKDLEAMAKSKYR